MPQTPEYTVRFRTPHEHQREKETPEPLTSAKASGKGMLPVWRRSPAIVAPTSSLYLENAEGQRSHIRVVSLALPRLGSRGISNRVLYVKLPCPSVSTSY
jgi:hypothetical protein